MPSTTPKKFKQKVVTFGGGTGQFHLLSGLRDLNDSSLITAVAGNWDNGGSSGRLRTELGVLPPGDIRRCVLALMEDEKQRQVAQSLFDDRLEEVNGPMKGHSLGNLISARLDHIFKGQDRGTNALRALFRIKANILPVSLTDLQLIAKTQSGIVIEGETNLDFRARRADFKKEDKIIRIYFNTRADPNPKVLEAIKEADKIVFAPGDLYTSLLPHLLVDQVAQAIIKSKAKVITVMNLMTKSGETDFYKASDHLKALAYYLEDPKRINVMIANNNHLDPEILKIYQQEGQEPVELDGAECKEVAPNIKIIRTKLANYLRKDHLLRHDPTGLAQAVLTA
ncbi:YvcK family protein [Candidatus Daviesbacteria bacterium]|nr:YvcK family protein [Candidatus Daviesbacteria bacterium]